MSFDVQDKKSGTAPLILLFYDGFELQAIDSPIGRLRSLARGLARRWYRTLRGRQVYTGFYVAFQNVVQSLRAIGCDVRINDFDAARRNPTQPIGIAGYPSVLAKTAHLPNPILFGPGDPGSPAEAAERAKQYAIRKIIQPCDWYVEYYAQSCGDLMVRYPVGIDTQRMSDASREPKNLDFLIYDKIRWDHENVYRKTIAPLTEALQKRGLSYKIIRYGAHTQAQFLDLVKHSRYFAFICEHETQGLACEEVMAMNIPVFAWDDEKLADPLQIPIAPEGLVVSSVPYWDSRCGGKFKTSENIDAQLATFLDNAGSYNPRQYIEENLSMQKCGEMYLDIYRQIH